MISSPEEFRERLRLLDPYQDEFVTEVDELVEQLCPEIGGLVYPSVFELFEDNPEADCGAPGTLIHHTESFYPNYLELLKNSVKRKPSFCGVLMINRILNSEIAESERDELVQILRRIIDEQNAPDVVVEMAESFIAGRE